MEPNAASTPSPVWADAHVDVYYGQHESRDGARQLEGRDLLSLTLASLYTKHLSPDVLQVFEDFVGQLPARIRYQQDLASTPKGNVLHLEGLDWFLVGRVSLDEIIERLQPAIVQPFYNTSFLGTGCTEDGRGIGDRGRAVIDQLDNARCLIDLAHAHPRTIDDVLNMDLLRPVLYSHGMLRDSEFLAEEIAPSINRALDLSHAQEIARRGGVVGLTPSSGFVRDLHAFCAQVARACELLGEDAVVIGSDMGGLGAQRLFGSCTDVRATYQTLEGMLPSYLPPTAIKKVLGLNLLAFLQRRLPLDLER